ncbi:hypothetical protein SAMN05421503_0842 [Terribacillus aidingensis]|uniref:Uncharacterized protein n=1 Tax=Terribacillus aidingensis TaxID=586416 RepID=A0A285NBH6_9BACI|nr:hypothetical protein [Terribacillus aidingensis]SNZ05031.1 hypothetical protein SAMN05421503_0842 [Terribacillus aidingensis]
MFPENLGFHTVIRFGLFLYIIFASIGGTIPVATILMYEPPNVGFLKMIAFVALLLVPLYSSCLIAWWIRARSFKRPAATSDKDIHNKNNESIIQLKSFVKKALRIILLVHTIVFSIFGIIVFPLFIFWVIPNGPLDTGLMPLSIAAFLHFGTCVLALWYRSMVPKY